MNRPLLALVADSAKQFAARTAHLRDSQQQPFPDMAAQLTLARYSDPLRPLLTNPGDRTSGTEWP